MIFEKIAHWHCVLCKCASVWNELLLFDFILLLSIVFIVLAKHKFLIELDFDIDLHYKEFYCGDE